jgi:hypothetical protein
MADNGQFGTIGFSSGESSGFAADVEHGMSQAFYGSRAEADVYTVAKGLSAPIPKSIFNEYALFNFRGLYGNLNTDMPFDNYKDSPNNELMGGEGARNVSITKLIEFFGNNYPKIGYRAQDFLYLKYYRKIPVNHLITLRRFPTPVNDNIFDLSVKYNENPDSVESTEKIADVNQVAGVTAVTYLGETAGNKLDDILKFTYGLKWKDIQSKMESVESNKNSYTSQPFYNKIGAVGRATADALKGVSPGAKFRAQNNPDAGGDRFGTTYANFVIGPVNVVDQTTVRDTGLKFENDIKLAFEYELKSLNYINPKIAMIDIISNMLTMTTNNAQFFGGGHRYYGSAGYVASTFGNMGLLRKGDFGGYIGSVVKDVDKGFKGLFGSGDGGFNILDGIKKLATTGLGNMLGGFLGDNMGAINGSTATAALISAEPTGNWHITVGNPLNPIVSMGNMYCDNTIMTLGNGLGYDDFPMDVKFEIDLKHGKPRDKGDIENMFNAGRGRIYASVANEGDILNLAGVDVKTYGSVKAGKSNLQKLQSKEAGAKQSDTVISNTKPGNGTKKFNAENDNGVDAAYISNLISMMVDS